jgi:hypothetical protein
LLRTVLFFDESTRQACFLVRDQVLSFTGKFMPEVTPIHLAHELDAAWILAIWKAIHGSDLSPVQIATEAIAALASP